MNTRVRSLHTALAGAGALATAVALGGVPGISDPRGHRSNGSYKPVRVQRGHPGAYEQGISVRGYGRRGDHVRRDPLRGGAGRDASMESSGPGETMDQDTAGDHAGAGMPEPGVPAEITPH